jgi:hypothetical protein
MCLQGLVELSTIFYGSTFGNALAALKRCIAGDIANITLQELWALVHKQERIRFR